MAEFDARAIGSIVATALKFQSENGEVIVIASPKDADQLIEEAPGLQVVSEDACNEGEVHFLAKDDYDRWEFSSWDDS